MVDPEWIRNAKVDWKHLKGRHMIRAPVANIRLLLRDEDELDGNTQERFEAWARGDCRDVRFEIDTRIASEMKHGVVPDYHNLDFYSHSSDADAMMREGYLNIAAWMYKGMTESIGMHYEILDDSMGDIWPFFEECMENLGKCVAGQDLSVEERCKNIKYLVGWSMVVFGDFMVYYDKVLEQLCADMEDLEIWKGVLEASLAEEEGAFHGGNHYFKEEIQNRHSHLLEIMEKAGNS